MRSMAMHFTRVESMDFAGTVCAIGSVDFSGNYRDDGKSTCNRKSLYIIILATPVGL